MKLVLKDISSEILISDNVFGSIFNKSLVHQVVTSYQSGSRQGTHAQKNRSRVSGSGRKPWRQKGTGRARAGSSRSPIWRSGGVTFASQPRSYRKKINRKMYRGALKSIFSELIRQDRVTVVDKLCIEEPRTKILVERLKLMDLNNNEVVLIILNQVDKNLFLASRNLYNVNVYHYKNIDPLTLVSSNRILMNVECIRSIEGMLLT